MKYDTYTKSVDIMGPCGTEIICRSCGYCGRADVIKSFILGAGKLERCPQCHGKNYAEVIVMKWKIDEWQGCYPSNWKGVIVPEAMSHPAKFSSKLIRKIYEHMKAEGWLKEGDMVLDPFGGVSLGALDAMRLGLRWRGIELEAKFVDLGAHNISNWNLKFHTMPHWCQDAKLLQGDSRFLLKVLGNGHNGAVSSPPYADISQSGGTAGLKEHGTGLTQGESCFSEYGPTAGQLGAMKAENFDAAISSPPYKNETQGGGLNVNRPATFRGVLKDGTLSMGESDGNLGAMPDNQFDAAISSPPFRHSEGGTPEPKPGGAIDAALYARHAAGNSAAEGYGGTDGQLANMPEGDFQGAVSSPPFVNSEARKGSGKFKDPEAFAAEQEAKCRRGEIGGHFASKEAILRNMQKEDSHVYGETDGQLSAMKSDGFDAAVSSPPFVGVGVENDGRKEIVQKVYNASGVAGARPNQVGDYKKSSYTDTYGTTEGNLGIETVDDFWLAARQIVEQVFLALAPGAHAAWVVKGFVKNKEYVDFPDQWRQLCEAVGFVTIHEHRAMLVHSKGKSHTLDGEVVEHKTESKSFFRRLAEKKGSPAINHETVWCMVKPEVVS